MGDINNYINTNFNSDDINNTNSEIDTLLNTAIEYFNECNIFSKTTIVGEEITVFGIVGFKDFINTTTLIPNLFRVCYSFDKLIIPNICNQFVSERRVINYIPKILDESTIKSLLYYNVPCNTKYYNFFENGIERVKKIKSILFYKKIKSTNSSFTNADDIFKFVYTQDSMLSQLLLFYKYLYGSISYIMISKEICDFILRWESTHACICSDLGCNKIIITGNLDGTYSLPNNTASILNFYYIKAKTSSTQIIDNSIFRILDYALQVYNDIILKINYYLKNLDYCEKDYMNINNIPKVYDIYNNFYKNQLETLTHREKTLCFDYRPVYNNLNIYLYNFNNTYKKNFANRYFLKNIILKENINVIIVYTNVSNWNNSYTDIYYYYYYITIFSPTPYPIFNINNTFSTSSKTYTNVIDFVNEFNTEYSLYTGITNYSLINNYKDGGFYPKGGTENNSQNIGYLYNFNKDFIYETLESYSPYNPLTESDGKGVALLIKNFL